MPVLLLKAISPSPCSAIFSSPSVVTLASILTTSRLADKIDFDYFFVAFDEIETTSLERALDPVRLLAWRSAGRIPYDQAVLALQTEQQFPCWNAKLMSRDQ